MLRANDSAEPPCGTKRRGEAPPRILLIVDEFGVLFERQDRVADRSASTFGPVWCDKRRAFGIHVLLGSQSAAGPALPPGQPSARWLCASLLQCSEADSRRGRWPKTTRLPGGSAGSAPVTTRCGCSSEGIPSFRLALFSDEDREELHSAQRHVRRQRWQGVDRKPIVFEGNEPRPREAQCSPLRGRAGKCRTVGFCEGCRDVAGRSSVSIRPAAGCPRRSRARSGSHLVIVTREEEEEGVGVAMATARGTPCAVSTGPPASLHCRLLGPLDAEWAGVSEILQAVFPPRVGSLAAAACRLFCTGGRRFFSGLWTRGAPTPARIVTSSLLAPAPHSGSFARRKVWGSASGRPRTLPFRAD